MITTMNQLLGSLVVTNEPLPADESTTVAVRTADGRIFRIDNVYYDQGDGYVVVEIQDHPVEVPAEDEKLAGKFGSGDPFDRWQCFSGTPGNRMMEEMYQSLAERLRSGELNRNTIVEALEVEWNKIPSEYGAHDSEPRNEIYDALDDVLVDLGLRKLFWEDN